MNPIRRFFIRLRIRLKTQAAFSAIRARMGIPLTARDKCLLFMADFRGWQKTRFSLAEHREAQRRRKICEGMPCWKRKPAPHCGVCGCSPVKFYLASSRCPRGHW